MGEKYFTSLFVISHAKKQLWKVEDISHPSCAKKCQKKFDKSNLTDIEYFIKGLEDEK